MGRKLLQEDQLRPYQERAIAYTLSRRYCALWLGMGLGKTVSVLTALRTMLACGDIERVLISAPLLVANETWPDEIAAWAHLRHLPYQRITGSRDERLAALRSPAPIHIINHENLVWLWKTLGPRRWPYDTIVLDESSRGFKTPKLRTAGKKKMTRLAAAIRARALPINYRLIELTGTPAPNGYLDLWSQMYLLDQGQRLGLTYESYKMRYFIENPYSREITMRPGAAQMIEEAIADLVLSMSEEDHLDLPERIYQNEVVRLPPKAKREYDHMARHFMLEHRDDVVAANSGVLAGKLLQLANGSVYNDQRDDVWLHDAKLEALVRIIESAQAEGEQVLVAYTFQFDLARIRKRFPKAVVLGEDPEAIHKWKTRRAGVMVCHPASAGHGLNLQAGGRLLVWYGLTHDLELYLQLNKRLHRGEQNRPVIIKHIVAEGTEDERVLPRLEVKNSQQAGLQRAFAVNG